MHNRRQSFSRTFLNTKNIRVQPNIPKPTFVSSIAMFGPALAEDWAYRASTRLWSAFPSDLLTPVGFAFLWRRFVILKEEQN